MSNETLKILVNRDPSRPSIADELGVGIDFEMELVYEMMLRKRERWRAIVFCTKELYGDANYTLLDPVLIQRLMAYRDHGQPVGDFLHAVITNNLRETIVHADEYNRATLFHLVAWMYNEFPSQLWGSEEKYSAWITTKNQERERAAQAAKE